MALIPPDAALRLRMQTEANLLQPLAPVQEIPSDLPELRAGQTFIARIQEALPENTYKALVAGKSLTLSLPEGAKAGDTLELVVVDRTPRTIVAQLKEPLVGQQASLPYPHATVSKAGQMIAQLLPREGEPPRPAALARGQPILPAPPQTADELAPALAKAVSQSGLFYEAHQAKWVGGRLPMETLLQEPQGQRSSPMAPNPPNTPTLTPVLNLQTPPGAEEMQRPAAEASTQSSQQAGTAARATVPEELRPIVQQQLDAVATQRLIWHGEAWPMQPMDWEIEWERGRREDEADDDESGTWRTTLRLTTPRLGSIDAQLRLTAAGVSVSLTAPSESSAEDLRRETPALSDSLASAGVPLLSLQVKHEAE